MFDVRTASYGNDEYVDPVTFPNTLTKMRLFDKICLFNQHSKGIYFCMQNSNQ